jgi:hypothetical protein
MLGIPLGLALVNATEWAVHKYILHGLGKDPKSPFAFHWHDHHRAARKHGGVDDAYRKNLFRVWNAQTKEALAILAGGLSVAPLLPVAPFFVGAVWYGAANYYIKHRRAHLDPAWARKHLPWHYDHHMGPNQHKNWCVTRPWMDLVMGTREPYVGTEREARDLEKRAARAATPLAA